MTRMFRPDPGELVDRMTILELKVEHSNIVASTEVINKDVDHVPGNKGKASRLVERKIVDKSALSSKVHIFLDELDLVRNHLIKDWIPDITESQDKIDLYDKYYDELSEVNSQLWDLEDQSRVLRISPNPEDMLVMKRKAELLDCISTLNDKRAKLVKDINALWGMQTQEKMHTGAL